MSAQTPARPRPSAETLELPSSGDVVQARYRVRQELGRGGMAIVLAAYDVVLEREVALKIMLPHLVASNEAVTRFVNEARSLARIESPHVVRVLDCGKLVAPAACAGLPFMVLELLRGEDLYSVAAREGGLSPERVVRYALEACAGLSAAHAQGIIHRDLKPENLFVALDADGQECLKVLDFGIARSRSRRAVTRGRAGLGSPGYMSPEQVQGAQKVDARSDVWGLGVVMYELLAHRPAFEGDDPHALCAQTLIATVVPLAQIRPELPRALVEIVERCLEREPAQRFGSVEALMAALGAVGVGREEPSRSDSVVVDVDTSRLDTPDGTDVVASDVVAGDVDTFVTPPPRRGRRAISWLLAGAILIPVVLLLPNVAQAPELAPARAWVAKSVSRAQNAWQAARQRTRELWMKEPGKGAAPGEP
ncbi:MAG TPA: serine/threonine-protein kinase [Polyangiaceae bacterium]|nr:serine/threonine-protein kinase [Polyangiaceae bacterium]